MYWHAFFLITTKDKIMDRNELQQHLNTILDNIAGINSLLNELEYDDFVKNEQVKEIVYQQLQEIGQIAFELEMQNPYLLDVDFDWKILSAFRNARYNQEAEIDHHMAYTVATEDLNRLADDLSSSVQLNLANTNYNQ